MTREEAIEYIKYCMCEGRLVGNTKPIIDEKWQAGMMAIEALKQDPCEDTISRQYLLDNCVVDKVTMPYVPVSKIENAPPVTPQPKTGHWIYTGDYLTDGMLKCSECGEEIDVSKSYYGFCPVCGAKMVEPQESEDKE